MIISRQEESPIRPGCPRGKSRYDSKVCLNVTLIKILLMMMENQAYLVFLNHVQKVPIVVVCRQIFEVAESIFRDDITSSRTTRMHLGSSHLDVARNELRARTSLLRNTLGRRALLDI